MTPIPFTIIGFAIAAALTGCAGYGQTPTPAGNAPAPRPDAGGLCNAQPAQAVVGQASTASVMESARARSGAEMARILRPGQMITKEFNAQRLNLQVDEAGRIISVYCG